MNNRLTGLFKLKVILLMLGIITLSGCDNNDAKVKAANTSAEAPASLQAEEAVEIRVQKEPADYDAAALEKLAKRYEGRELTILDASESQLDGSSTLIITFSIPLNPNQSFSSNVHLVDSVSGKVDGAWELSDNLMELRLRHLEPRRKLTLTIDSGIKGINGAFINFNGNPSQYSIETKDIVASVGFASRGSLLPSKIAEGLPVIALNVKSVDVDFFRIKQNSLPSFISSWGKRASMPYWDSSDFLKSADLVYSGRFDLNPRRNTRETILLPLAAIKPLQEDGVYLAVMKQAGTYDTYMIPATMFTLSDIGLSVHSYNDRIDIFTQALETGKVLKGIDVTLLDTSGNVVAQAVTDNSGHAQLAKVNKAAVVLASNNGQTSMVTVNQSALDLSEFAISGQEGYKTQFFAFGPRDIYRPGETLIVNGLLRDADGKLLPEQPIKVDVLKPDAQVARSFVWQPENGLYQYLYSIPESAPTGNWSLRFNLGDNHPRYYQFKVEDFMPERMALDIKADKTPVSTTQPVTFDITGSYLYGAPASGNSLQGAVLLQPNRAAVSALPGFEFGSITEEGLSRRIDDFEQQLDSNGFLSFKVNNYWAEARSPVSVIMQASLLESGGRPVTRRAEQAVWPTETMPGIRPLFALKEVYDYTSDRYKKQPMVDEDSIADFEIVYTNIDGKKLAYQDLQAQLIQERRDYYWRWSDSDGWQSGYDQKDLVMDTISVSTNADQTAKVSFPVDWGSYRIEVKDPDSNVISSVRFWAGYSWQENSGDHSGSAVRPDQVKLKIDKPSYTPGDKIKLHVEAPAAGKGYLLVESNDEPLWWQEIDVPTGGAEFDVPLNKEWVRHDLYLSAIVIRPGDKSLHATPKRAVGVLHIPLASEQRKLDIKLDAPVKMEPNQVLKIKVKANTANGKSLDKINVLVSAVDTGVLNITNFATPDPYNAFFGRKRYSIDMFDVYGQLIEGKGRKANLQFGGDGDDELGLSRGGMKPVTIVNIIAQQAEPIKLNANGEGEVELFIPDFNGELRLMAQAWNDEDFGSAESKIIVASPLIVELATPRFMAGGDESVLAMDIRNMSGVKQNLKVTLSTKGLVGLTRIIEEPVALDKDAKTILYIPVTALNGFGSGDITVKVDGLVTSSGSPRVLQRMVTIGVRPAHPAKTENFATIIRPGDVWALPNGNLSGLDLTTVQAQLAITSRPPLNLRQYISELYAYPYGCLEQTTSGLFPSLYTTSQQLTALGIKTGTDDARRKSIDVGIERLLGMQNYTGGFGYWSNNGDESYWGTVYVSDFLLRANQQGYSIPEQPLNKAVKRLQEYLQNRNQIDTYYGNSDATRFAVQAYAGLVLAQQQKASLGDLRQLYERRSEAASGLPLIQLGVALKLMGDEGRSEQAIKMGLNTSRKSGWYSDYGSKVRDKALILSLLTENNLLPTQRDKFLLSLSDDLHSVRYLSTQEKNAVFMAGRNFIGKNEPKWSASLKGGVSQKWSQSQPVNVMLSGNDLNNEIELVNNDMQSIYPRLTITGYPLAAPAPESNNLNIKREYFDTSGKPVSLSTLKTGQLLVVHLRITTKTGNVPDALVVDLLPAGLELENQNLGDSSASLKYSTGNLSDLVNKMQQAKIAHQEFRDDRYVAAISVSQYQPVSLLYLVRAVTPGVYTVPAPMVESMYQPEVRAIGTTVEKLRINR